MKLFKLCCLTTALCFFVKTGHAQAFFPIGDEGWNLWPDTAAAWQNDPLFLPGEVSLSTLPVNPPTGGWAALNPENATAVNLPATVEQHFWGLQGLRPYAEGYLYEKSDAAAKDGSYRGVSWWWKPVEIPAGWKGKTVLLTIPAARLRAEVFWNDQLVGYHLIGETSFQCDLTPFIRPGEVNRLAIRITNPGGRFDWLDTQLMQWGEYAFHASHGFGGLSQGLLLEAHDSVFISDLYVLNRPEQGQAVVHLEARNNTGNEREASVLWEVLNQEGKVVVRQEGPSFRVPPHASTKIQEAIKVENARPWNLDSPYLYQARATLRVKGAGTGSTPDRREARFGFRWFTAEGIGENAYLAFNGQRIRLLSAISWGFWGLNGLFPTPELARKEVLAAKALGFNCLQFHRNIGKSPVLEQQDELGLLRYMEPGGGVTALGKDYFTGNYNEEERVFQVNELPGSSGAPKTFAEKYMEEKIVRMVRDHREHPSLVMYAIQNEMSPDLNNPRIAHLLRRMRAEDPSRIILLKSGVPTINQAWMLPYQDSILFDHGDGYSGWADQHTVGGPGVWTDSLYKNPSDFTHRTENKREITVWGEMLGAATPDNHEAMVAFIQKNGGKSYDLQDHTEILAAYDTFLDKWDFRATYPTAGALFQAIGTKAYDFWGQVIETAKLSDENDFLVVSGWESTALDNHSGLLDNQRNFKSDPALIRGSAAPVVPVVKPASAVVEKGQPLQVDLWLINESHEPAAGPLVLTLTGPDGQERAIGSYDLPPARSGQFSYLVGENISTPVLTQPGVYRLTATLNSQPEEGSSKEILVVDTAPDAAISGLAVGVIGAEKGVVPYLQEHFQCRAESYDPAHEYDVLVAIQEGGRKKSYVSDLPIAGTEDDYLFQSEDYGPPGELEYLFTGLPSGRVEVSLLFAELYCTREKQRIFDVAINGRMVLDDLDLFAEAGKERALIKTVVADTDGDIRITFPEAAANMPKICGIRLVAGSQTIAVNAGGQDYTDKNGLVWKAYRAEDPLGDALFEKVSRGAKLVVLSLRAPSHAIVGQVLEDRGIIDYRGVVANARAPWMGSWVFTQKSPLFEGLPQGGVMGRFYQLDAMSASGILLNGDVEIHAAYGRDHDRNIGAACFSASYGEGAIIFLTLEGLIPPVAGAKPLLHPLTAKMIWKNILRNEP